MSTPKDSTGRVSEPSNLVDILRWRAMNQPARLAYTFLLDGETEQASLTYKELDSKARAIAGLLQSMVKSGERALLLYTSGQEFIPAFFGCLYAGVIAVPAYPPDPARLNRTLPRFEAIARDAQPVVALTTTPLLPLFERLGAEYSNLQSIRWLATDHLAHELGGCWKAPSLDDSTLAFLQYTSGSTATPKGVMVSHGNLMHNERMIQRIRNHTEHSTFVTWLPLFHDMGLIGTMLQPMFLGARSIIMSPIAFLQKPLRWLQAISRYRAATSGAPNFAYDACVRKTTPQQRAKLDLSSWTTAFNGSEPVRSETIDRFVAAFEPCGFRREAFFPCYGLAEATLIVSGTSIGSQLRTFSASSAALESNRAAAAQEGEPARTLVSCGQTCLGQRVVVVNPASFTMCDAGAVGEVWVSGPSVAHGYWNRPEESEATFNAYVADTGEGPFLRTGDMGFLSEGDLFITGRLKDLIIIRGRNHYPQDIEMSVERIHPMLRQGCGAAFSIEAGGEERLAVVQEIDEHQQTDLDEVIERIRQAIAEEYELQVHAVALIRPGSIAKTSSGKIQRHACRAALLEGSLDLVTEWRAPIKPQADAPRSATTFQASEQGIRDWLVSRLAAKLAVEAGTLPVDKPLSRFGLDSITALELAHSIETELGAGLPMTVLLQSYTVAELAAEIFAQSTTTPAHKIARERAQKRGSDYPLSRGQQALWFLHQLAPGSAAYNISAAARIRGHIDADALRRAFQLLVDRHAALRTTFRTIDGEPAQRVSENVPVYFRQEDASGWSEDSLNHRLVSEAHRPFDLEQGPLMRVGLFTRSTEDHVLLLVIHHAVADFWSLGVITGELAAIYEAEKANAPASLEPPALLYTDYVRWQEEILAREGERLWSYWQRQLSGELPVLELPTDRPRPPVQTFTGSSVQFELGEELTRSLKQLADEQGATLYTVLMAGFQALLHRYSGQRQIIVGSPTTGRSRAEFKDVVGYFVNSVALRADFSTDPAFYDLLDEARRVVIEALEHQDYPFALLVERLQPRRDASRSPLFQAMFVLQRAPLLDQQGLSLFALGEEGAKLHLGSMCLESVALEQRVAQFDLTLMMAEADNRLVGSLQYNTDLFERATISRMAAHFHTLLEGIVATPHRRVSQLPLLTQAEERLLKEWNRTQADGAHGLCVHQLFEAQAERAPAATALVFEGERVSYDELNRRANRLAHYLQSLGVGAETRVGVCLSRSTELVVALLAILKAGGAYVPLDPNYPKERSAFILEDAQASLLITEESLADATADYKGRRIFIDKERAAIISQSYENISVDVKPENLGYVIYTSGSTGKPKGVAIEHRSTVAMLSWAAEVFSREALEGVLASTSICFDLSVFELFLPLSCGGKVILAANVLSLTALEAANEVRLVNTVPSAIAELLKLDGLPESVRTVNLAGEPLQNRLAQQVYDQAHVEKLYNLYGPSEDTTYSTYALIDRGSTKAVSIGRPVSNSRVYLLDVNQQPVPVGFPGELYMAGAGLARGYLNRPDLTAERFLPDPFGEQAGARMYKTGDLARYMPDGNIEFLGRLDYQVKVRGFRIELGEIEAALRQHPEVRDTVVVVREDAAGDKRIIAYVVAQGPGAQAGELRSFLRKRLPEYMVPSAFVMLDLLPLTPNGKVDRRALPSPDLAASAASESFVAARNPVEEILSAIWADVLGVTRVGISDNFFELGGHSLLATKVISRAREAFRVELPVSSLFQAPTVASLAEIVSRAKAAGGDRSSGELRIARVSRDEPLPLSFAQQRLWVINRMAPDSPVYNVSFLLRFEGRTDAAALERAVNAILNRHESLRTSFTVDGSEPVQVINSPARSSLPVEDLRRMPEAEREAAAAALALDESRSPFDLTRAPLLRAKLVRLGELSHVMIVTAHHVAFDGWSMEIFIKELAALYEESAAGKAASLPELNVQYADYAVWQREWLRGETLDAQLSYWKLKLSGAPPVLQLPADRPRPPVQTFDGAAEMFKLSPDLTALLRGLSRREGVTLFMTLMAAFKALLYRYTGREDMVVGTPVANRDRVEIEPLIGFFSNLLVLRTDLSGNPDFLTLLARVRDVALEAYSHQDLPIERLVEELQLERSLGHTPLSQVVLTLHDNSLQPIELSGLSMRLAPLHNRTSKFDLLMNLWEKDGALEGALEYSTDLFDAATMARLVGHFATLLESIAQDAARPLSALPFLTEQERRALLGWNNAGKQYPRDECLPRIFEAQVERTPNREALTVERERLTYRQLNRRANHLAHRLISLGVGPEARVALCVERSAEMIVGMLAILKAGGAYVPLDPNYPKERLAFMLDDSRPLVLLTRSELVDSLPAHEAKIILLDAEPDGSPCESDANPGAAVSGDNAAYVIYTSGSTGRPKGVVVTHANVLRLFLATQSWFDFDEDDVWALFHSYAFDFSVWEIWGALLYGGRLVVVPYLTSRSPEALHELLIEERVSVLNQTPSAFRQLMRFDQEQGAEREIMLRVVIFGGEALDVKSLKGWIESRGDERPQLVNMYGITETTVHVTYRRVTAVDLTEGAISPIGKAFPDLQVYLLDKNMELAPVGVPAEIYVGGDGLARGYLNRPELTAERFLPNPFANKAGERLYKSGDMAKYMSNGEIEYLGRADDQVKVRGYRIELREIEAILEQHPQVRHSAVVTREEIRDEKILVAYVSGRQGELLTTGELRAFLKEKLPDYMVPERFVMLDTLPLTENGKIDRRALPAPDALRPELEVSYVAPQTEAERTIAAIWRELFRVDRIGVHDNFFELGGTSLLMVQAANRLQEAFQRSIPIVEMFKHTSVAALAEYLTRSTDESAAKDDDHSEGRRRAMERRARFRKEHRARDKR